MMTMVIELMVAVILGSLIILNQIGLNKTKKRRQNICWEHKIKMVLGFNEKDVEIDLIADKDKLKMHNNGTNLNDECDKLCFILISSLDGEELFMKRRN